MSFEFPPVPTDSHKPPELDIPGADGSQNPSTECIVDLSRLERDEDYHCQVIHILVENCLFCVPCSIFEESTVFRDMFNLPSQVGRPADGSSDEHPLVLYGITKEDFKRWLRLAFPLRHRAKLSLSTKEEWTSVLKLSTMWDIASMRDAAVAALSKLFIEPIEKLILAHQYNVNKWILPALNELARRKHPVNIREGNRLSAVVGWEYVLKIGHVREARGDLSLAPLDTSKDGTVGSASPSKRSKASAKACCAHCGHAFPNLDCNLQDFTSVIKTTFGI